MGIGWWITSALESNIGLNAIAQFTDTYKVNIPQGLGTGKLFSNNIDSPLYIQEGKLGYDKKSEWGRP
jgi:O-succinylbenzoate synthase